MTTRVLAFLAFIALFCACATDDLSGVDARVRDGASDVGAMPSDATADGTATDAAAIDAAPGDSACAVIEGRAEIVRRPLDVIVVVDSSSSFNRPRSTISGILVPSLIAELERERVDYRVIVVGGAITAPPPTVPPRYFYVSASIGSGGLLAALPGYLRLAIPNLREDSLKAVIDFSDGLSGIGVRASFFMGMMAPDLVRYFGDTMSRRYIMHTVAGLANNTPSTMPWQPTDPVVNMQCAGFSAVPCQELQQISITTGGYRFPLCNFMEYGPFFNAVALQAISGVRLACEFGQPTTTDGRMPDIMYAVLTVRDGMGMTRTYHPVANAAACGEGFYLMPGTAGMPGRVVLCPTTCGTVQMDERATASFAFECPPA